MLSEFNPEQADYLLWVLQQRRRKDDLLDEK
jgi:hypothetical protein